MGIGSSVRKLTVDSLADALRIATTDLKQIERAKLVGEKIRAVSTMILASRPGILLTGSHHIRKLA